MATLLVRNCHTLVTMDAARREVRDGALLIEDHVIRQVGRTADLPATADHVLDLRGRHLVLPGLVNTHHHFYQNLTRVVPAAQDCDLFGWLRTLYPIWSRLDPEGVRASAQLAAAELMLSGCTTSSDHLYLFPNGCRLDDEIHAVAELGLRFHPTRGSMSVGESHGGLPPDSLVENEAEILRDSQRLIAAHHDPRPHAMVRMSLAPCSPFSVSRDLMRESAALARSHPGVRLHTHLAENRPDVEYSLAKFGVTPGEYAESVGWVGPDVWHAHCVHLSPEAITLFGRTGTGVAHCPCSNMRLASGIAPVRRMRCAGVPVGLGVDGAASNDASNLLHEARAACLLARVGEQDATALTARQALELATLGGARVLGRDDIGHLAPGMAADFIAINLDRPAFAGTHRDPVAATVLCQCDSVDYTFIHGRCVVAEGRLVATELPRLVERANAASRRLLGD